MVWDMHKHALELIKCSGTAVNLVLTYDEVYE